MEQLQTAFEAFKIGLVFIAVTGFAGYGVSSLLLPAEWRRYQALLVLPVGWCALVVSLFFVNLVLGVQTGLYLVLVLALLLNLLAFRRKTWKGAGWREAAIPGALALCLVGLTISPHIVQRSLGFMTLNQDEEIYYPIANYVLSHSSTVLDHPLARAILKWRPWGWGFQYTVSSVSAISGEPTFQTYMPTAYFILGLSVFAWYFLFRETFRLSRATSAVAVAFYCLLGLPAWFVSFGYGPQATSYITFPLGAAVFAQAVEKGGTRRIVLAGLVVAAGMVSFYRGIGLQYVLLFIPIGLVALARLRNLAPLGRGIAVAAVVLVVGLPCNWDAFQYYIVQGAISNPDRLDMTGGWGLDYYQPASVMLGLESFPIAHDEEGTRPLARFAAPLGALSGPAAWLVLAGAAVGLVIASRRRPVVAAVAAGSVASLALNRYGLDFPYGYVKLMPIAAPLAYSFFAVTLGETLPRAIELARRPAVRAAAVAAGALPLILVVSLVCYTTYDAIWSNATGWGQSIPGWIPEHVRSLRQEIPADSRVFFSGRFSYPVPEDRLRTRQHMLGMRTEDEQRRVWGQRVLSIALTEFMTVDSYGWVGDGIVSGKVRRLLDDEAYDYYLLGPDNDPRLEGLDGSDAVWSDNGLTLYATKGIARQSPWLIERERGSLAITPDRPLTVSASTGDISSAGTALTHGSPGKGRVRIGILSFGHSEATISSGSFSRKLVLEEGLTWYTTPEMSLPSSVAVTSPNDLGVVSLRVLGTGPEEQQFVARSIIGYYLYASSTLLSLEDWLADPFKGAKPGSV